MNYDNFAFELQDEDEQIQISQTIINLADRKINLADTTIAHKQELLESIETENAIMNEAFQKIQQLQLARKKYNSNN